MIYTDRYNESIFGAIDLRAFISRHVLAYSECCQAIVIFKPFHHNV